MVLVLNSVPSRTLQGEGEFGEVVVGFVDHLQMPSVADLLRMRCRRPGKHAVLVLLLD